MSGYLETILDGVDPEGSQVPGTEPGTHLGSHIPQPRTAGSSPHISFSSFPCLRWGLSPATFKSKGPGVCGAEKGSCDCFRALRAFRGRMGRARALPVCGCLCVCIFVIRGCNDVCEARDMVSAALCVHGGVPGNILAAHCSCRPPPP